MTALLQWPFATKFLCVGFSRAGQMREHKSRGSSSFLIAFFVQRWVGLMNTSQLFVLVETCLRVTA